MTDLPATAAWRHVEARTGFEVLFLQRDADGYRFEGRTTAVEEGEAWSVRYAITLNAGWETRSAHIIGESGQGPAEVRLERGASGIWRIDGRPAAQLDGYVDVDLEASAFTNAFPINRMGLEVGQTANAPAVYVRAPGLAVEPLEQSYTRLDDEGERSRYDYASPSFEYQAQLIYDEFGLILDYPGLAIRVL